jgi:hypothetical protein
VLEIARAIWEIEQKAAKERRLASLKRGDKSPVQESFLNGGKTRDKIGAFAGGSGRQVEKIMAVQAPWGELRLEPTFPTSEPTSRMGG